MWTDGARPPSQDQRPNRPDTVIPAVLPRRRVRLMRDEHRRGQHTCLSDADGQPEERDEPHHAAAAPGGSEGSRSGPPRSLCAIRFDRAVDTNRSTATGSRAPSIARGTRKARRLLGMHSLLLLFDVVPELLVESGSLSRPIDPAAVRSMVGRQSGSTYQAAPRPARGSVPSLSLPHHHELHQHLPERAQPGACDFRHQADDDRTRLIGASSILKIRIRSNAVSYNSQCSYSLSAVRSGSARRASSQARIPCLAPRYVRG